MKPEVWYEVVRDFSDALMMGVLSRSDTRSWRRGPALPAPESARDVSTALTIPMRFEVRTWMECRPAWSPKWGQFVITPDFFTRLVYHGV